MEKYDLLTRLLIELQRRGVLRHFVLVGSWCLDVYRHHFGNPVDIPATRTMDADLLVPRRLPSFVKLDIVQLMEAQGFIAKQDYPSGFHRFVHSELNVEFLTEAGAKAGTGVHAFAGLNLVAQELRFMSIPLKYPMRVSLREDLEITVPEPGAFALHKLIVMGLRTDEHKARKDLEAAVGLLRFICESDERSRRLREIYSEFPRGWKKRVDDGLIATAPFIENPFG